MAAFEVEYRMSTSKGIEEMAIGFFRYLGWHAARRTGLIDSKLSRDEFLDTVIAVEPVDDEEEGAVVPADPTSPAA